MHRYSVAQPQQLQLHLSPLISLTCTVEAGGPGWAGGGVARRAGRVRADILVIGLRGLVLPRAPALNTLLHHHHHHHHYHHHYHHHHHHHHHHHLDAVVCLVWPHDVLLGPGPGLRARAEAGARAAVGVARVVAQTLARVAPV